VTTPEDPVPRAPGPGERPAVRQRRRWLGPLALGVGSVGLVVAVLAGAVAVQARSDARAARDLAIALRTGGTSGPAGVPSSTTGPTTGATGSTGSTEPPSPNSTGGPVITDRTTYTPKYEHEPLTLSVPACGRQMGADLDEPRVNVEAGRDVTMSQACLVGAPYTFAFADGVDATTEATRDSTPTDCVDKIRRAPIGPRVAIPLRKSLVVCLTTSYEAAVGRGDKWRLVRIEVTGISGDGNASIDTSAWDIT